MKESQKVVCTNYFETKDLNDYENKSYLIPVTKNLLSLILIRLANDIALCTWHNTFYIYQNSVSKTSFSFFVFVFNYSF